MKVIANPGNGTVTLKFDSIADLQAHYSNLKKMLDYNRTRTGEPALEYEMRPEALAKLEEESNGE